MIKQSAFSITLLAMVLFLVPACGFTPIYGDNYGGGQNTSVRSELNDIDIALIPDRDGQFLRNALIDRFYSTGTPASPRYKLSIAELREDISDFDITVESEATRKQIKLNSSMVLIDLKNNKPVLERTLTSITSHNVLESEFSTLVTEQSAREAALHDLARQIERQLALYFNR